MVCYSSPLICDVAVQLAILLLQLHADPSCLSAHDDRCCCPSIRRIQPMQTALLTHAEGQFVCGMADHMNRRVKRHSACVCAFKMH